MTDPQVEEAQSGTLSIVVGKEDCLSPVTRIRGYPWRLRLYKTSNGVWELFVKCEKSSECEHWETEADCHLKVPNIKRKLKFGSVARAAFERQIEAKVSEGILLTVEILPHSDGDMWIPRPTLRIFDPRDGILVIENKKFHVNKESLASQSPYFERLFNGDFIEKNMTEIPIGDVSAEEFTILMRMLYGENGASVVNDLLTKENVHRVLQLVDRFAFKSVQLGVINTLLSSSSIFTIHERLLIADQYNLLCKDRILSQFTDAQLMNQSFEYRELSTETKDALLRKYRNALKSANDRIENMIRILSA